MRTAWIKIDNVLLPRRNEKISATMNHREPRDHSCCLHRARGADVTLFSPRASAMGTTGGD